MQSPSLTTMPPAISVSGVTKRYGPVTAVDGVDLDIAEGEVYALLGPNGAGKTTLVEMLEGFRKADSGEISVLGMDPADGSLAFRSRIGVVLQSQGSIDTYTARELVSAWSAAYPSPMDPEAALELVGLSEHADRRGKKFSGGMRRRLDFALGVVGNPDLLFLDEPTTGFDAVARRQSWEVVRSLSAEGRTILLTTHYLDEAEALADRIGVISEGKLIIEGTIWDLRRELGTSTRISWRPDPELDLAGLPQEASAWRRTDSGRLTLETNEPTRLLRDLIAWSASRGLDELPELWVRSPSLEEIYLELVGAESEAQDPPLVEAAG